MRRPISPVTKAAARLLLVAGIPQRDCAVAVGCTAPTVSAIAASISPGDGLDEANLTQVVRRLQIESGCRSKLSALSLLSDAGHLAVERVSAVLPQFLDDVGALMVSVESRAKAGHIAVGA